MTSWVCRQRLGVTDQRRDIGGHFVLLSEQALREYLF